MRIAFLAAATSVHAQRWVAELARRGHEIILFTQHPETRWVPPISVRVEFLRRRGSAGYIFNVQQLRRRISIFRPEVLNCHYASGYGTTAALCGFHPLVMSVWGSDVYDFPYQAWWKHALIRANLRRADIIASTSYDMAGQVRRLVPELKHVMVTPFGVDCEKFKPVVGVRDSRFHTIGTTKGLALIYGIDLLVRAFALVSEDRRIAEPRNSVQLRLIIVGHGGERAKIECLATSLGVESRIEFVGYVPHEEIPKWLNLFDVFVAPSRQESFGVSVIEASACGIPVIVSDAGGLPEVVQAGKTGYVVPKENVEALAESIVKLLIDRSLQLKMGEAGRKFVQSEYEWGNCVDRMEDVYQRALVARIE